MDAGEGELGLRLDAERAQNAKPLGSLDCVLEHRGLADPRLAAQDEGAAATLARRVEHRVDSRALELAADQHHRRA